MLKKPEQKALFSFNLIDWIAAEYSPDRGAKRALVSDVSFHIDHLYDKHKG